MSKFKTNKSKEKKGKKIINKAERHRMRVDRRFRVDINTMFTNAGFTQIPSRDAEIEIENRRGEIDNIFIYENVIVCVEDTTGTNVKEHILKSVDFFNHLKNNKEPFINSLDLKFEKFKNSRQEDKYTIDDYNIKFMYISLHGDINSYIERHPEIIFMKYSHLQYFVSLSKIIGYSMKYELLRYFDIKSSDIGTSIHGKRKCEYNAIILPESPSGFPKDHKIVTLLIDPKSLLEQSYVMRQNGWEKSEYLYQRLLIKNKIKEMREYLSSKGRVFINNIIATLPNTVRFLDENGNTIDMNDLKKAKNVILEWPIDYASIGIIDGQHRLYAYYEGSDKYEERISILRSKQHLLLTAIVYPSDLGRDERAQFEAQIFLEINDKQSRTKGDLKQIIQTIVEPFSTISIAKRVMSEISEQGPLSEYLERYFYDKGKIKTTSIVSYGLKNIVGIEEYGTMFQYWNHDDKDDLLSMKNHDLLNLYINYCSNQLNMFINGFKQNISHNMWTNDMKISRLMTTTTINGLIFCYKSLINNGQVGDFDYYRARFVNIDIDFSPSKFPYKSSHWRDLGNNIYEQCFRQ